MAGLRSSSVRAHRPAPIWHPSARTEMSPTVLQHITGFCPAAASRDSPCERADSDRCAGGCYRRGGEGAGIGGATGRYESLCRRLPVQAAGMRIVRLANFITPCSGGLRTALQELGAGYAAAGHEPVLIMPGAADQDEQTPQGRVITLPPPARPLSAVYPPLPPNPPVT